MFFHKKIQINAVLDYIGARKVELAASQINLSRFQIKLPFNLTAVTAAEVAAFETAAKAAAAE